MIEKITKNGEITLEDGIYKVYNCIYTEVIFESPNFDEAWDAHVKYCEYLEEGEY